MLEDDSSPGLPGWVGGRTQLWDGADGERPRERRGNRLRRGLGGEGEGVRGDPRDDALGKGFGNAGDGELLRKKRVAQVKSRKAENYAV